MTDAAFWAALPTAVAVGVVIGVLFTLWFDRTDIGLRLFERINHRQIEEANARLDGLMRSIEKRKRATAEHVAGELNPR